MRAALLAPSLLILVTSARAGELDKEKLRELVQMPRIGFSFGWGFNTESGFSLNTGEPRKEMPEEDPKAEIEKIKKAVVGDASDAERYRKLTDLYRKAKDEKAAQAAHAKSLELYERQVKARPEDLEARLGYAWALGQAKRPDDAEREVRQATRIDHNHSRAWHALALLLMDRAIKLLLSDLGVASLPDPFSFADWDTLMRVMSERKSTEELRKALRLLEEAGECCDRAAKADPKNLGTHYLRAYDRTLAVSVQAWIQHREAKPVEAQHLLRPGLVFHVNFLRELAKEVADCFPDDPLQIGMATYAELTFALLCSKMLGESREGPVSPWESLPENHRKTVTMAMDRLRSLAKSEDSRKAVEALESLAILHAMLDERETASKCARQALALDSQRDVARTVLLATLSGDELTKISKEGLTLKDTPRNRLIYSKALQEQAEYDGALAVMEPVLKTHPKELTAPWAAAALLMKRSGNRADLERAGELLDHAGTLLTESTPLEDRCDFRVTQAIQEALIGRADVARLRLKGVLIFNEDHKYARSVLEVVGEEK